MVKRKIERILTFDLMRGYFLVGILIDHLRFFPNGLGWWSARGGLFSTMAEGFFLISGVVLGIVRGAKLVDKPFKPVAKLLMKRGLQLYVTTVVLTLLFTFIVWWFLQDATGVKPGAAPLGTPILQLLWETMTLQYFYGWADYLRLYSVFIFVSPLIVWLLRKGWWYIGLAASLGVWLLFPDPQYTSGIDQERLQLLSWQLLFYIGLTIGFYWPKLEDWWHGLSKAAHYRILIPLWSIAGVTFLYNVAIMLSTMGYDMGAIGATPQLQHDLYVTFFDKERLPLMRILLAMLWFWAAFAVVRRFEATAARFMGWLLLTFGQNSLYVYTVHAFMIFFIHIYISRGSLLFNMFIVLSCVALTLVMLRYRVLMKIIPR